MPAGYQPASNIATGNTTLLHLYTGGVATNPLITYYKKRALDRLMKKFVFRDACVDDMLPRQSGRTVQWFRYQNLAANTTAKDASSEGAVGTALALNSQTVQATISQYTDFITLSDLLMETAIDPMAENAADLLSYRAGLSVDTIVRNVIDAGSASMTLIGQYFAVADARSAAHILQGNDVRPMESGPFNNFFMGVIHPYISYDLVQDPQAGGLADIYKYTDSKPMVRREDRGMLAPIAGVQFVESTNVKLTAGTPNLWRAYVFGQGGFGAVDLEGRGPNKIKDPEKQRFTIRVVKPQPSTADPEGVIGAFISYNYKFVAVELYTSGEGVHRSRYWDAPSSIVP